MLKRIVVSAVLCGVVAQPALAAACYTPVEARAATVRQLQTELMVAALKCQSFDGMSSMYNAFVRKFGPNLSENAQVLRGHFSRSYGSDHARRFDTFITTLANEASIKSVHTPNYCSSMTPVFQSVLDLRHHELEEYAERTVQSNTQACSTKVETAQSGKSAKVAKASAKAEKQ